MKIIDPLQMNDWPIKKFFIFIITFHLLLLGSIGLDSIGFRIPILRQLVGFIYLTFVPGVLILRVLRLHKLGSIESLLYSVGLSLSFLMFLGFLMNTIYPSIGISKPISMIPLVATINIIVLILCVLCNHIDNNYSSSSFIYVNDLFSVPTLFLFLIPLLSIFGTYFVNLYTINILLVLLLIIISLIIYLVAFNILPIKYYPLAIFIVSISLLYHTSLISMHIVEWADTSFEYWCSKRVLVNSIWDPNIYSNVNAMLSIVMLPPIYSIITDLSLTWVYKIIFPLLFSFLPVGLYRIFERQTDSKTAFFSSFFFMSMFNFYTTMLGLSRQQIAELFFVIFVLLIIDEHMDTMKKSILSILFVLSIAVSHYAFSYISLFCLLSALFILIVITNISRFGFISLKNFQIKKINFKNIFFSISNNKFLSISSGLVSIFAIFTISWYMYISESYSLILIISIGNNILNNLFNDFLSVESTQGLNMILQTSKTGVIGDIYKIIHLISQFFISIGLIYSILNLKKMKIHLEYFALSIPFFLICIAGIIVPYFASAVNTDRLYGICLVILSLYCTIGGIAFIRYILNRLNITCESTNYFKILAIFFSIYFLFNSGLVYEFSGHPRSYALNQTAVNKTNFDIYDVTAVRWVSHNVPNDAKIDSDVYNAYLIQMELGYFNPFQKNTTTSNHINYDSYVFIGSDSIENDRLWLDDPKKPRLNVTSIRFRDSELYKELISINTIYNTNNAKVYYDSLD